MASSAGILAQGLRQLDLHVGLATTLAEYIGELERWNSHYRFVATAGSDIVIRHVLDALAGARIIREHARRGRILDVGSGVGLPGLPLAISIPECEVVLLERSAKKAAFLTNMIISLRLKNASVLNLDLRRLTERYDIVTFRAVSGLASLVDSCSAVTAIGGRIIAYKGRLRRILREIEPLQSEIRHVETIQVRVPFLEAERHLVVVEPTLVREF